MKLTFAGAIAALLLACMPVLAQLAPNTEDIFDQYKNRVVQVRVIDLAAGSRSSYGSGFGVEDGARLVTNYHVISRLVLDPDKYRIELRMVGGTTQSAKLETFDAVHDLAVLRPEHPLPAGFAVLPALPPQGTRVYSFGVPNDLDFTIVEGTNNGLIGYTFYDRVHYTGAINPGMSGGPAIDGAGRVVGVNVAKQGDGVSFLVPAASVVGLLAQPVVKGERRALLRTQLLAHQARVMAALLDKPMPQHTLGRYRLPGQFASYLRCWGESEHGDKQRYREATYQCGNDDGLFLDEGFETGQIALKHIWLSRDQLGRVAFNGLVNGETPEAGGYTRSHDELGNFACEHGSIAQQNGVVRTALCMRSYRKLAGLYDMQLQAARIDDGKEGYRSVLWVSGVTRDNALKLARRYVEAMQ